MTSASSMPACGACGQPYSVPYHKWRSDRGACAEPRGSEQTYYTAPGVAPIAAPPVRKRVVTRPSDPDQITLGGGK